MEDFIKVPCKHCPFRLDVKPFLTPERGEELAYHAQNPYNSFHCHKTYGHDDDGFAETDEKTKECAGFLTLRAAETGEIPEGFTPSYDMCYDSSWDMSDAYNSQ